MSGLTTFEYAKCGIVAVILWAVIMLMCYQYQIEAWEVVK